MTFIEVMININLVYFVQVEGNCSVSISHVNSINKVVVLALFLCCIIFVIQIENYIHVFSMNERSAIARLFLKALWYSMFVISVTVALAKHNSKAAGTFYKTGSF